MDTLNTWKTGEYRGGLGSLHSVTVKKWLQECESSLLDGAIENNSIGCIFALKANYGYAETAPVQAQAPQQTAALEDIQSRYREIADQSNHDVAVNSDNIYSADVPSEHINDINT